MKCNTQKYLKNFKKHIQLRVNKIIVYVDKTVIAHEFITECTFVFKKAIKNDLFF